MTANREPTKVTLLLEKGVQLDAFAYGNFDHPRFGELVFCTAMTGIEEALTDPSYCEQIVVTSVAHVGNTGFTGEDMESKKLWAEGLVCRELETVPSNWRAKKPLHEWIVDEGRFVLFDVNTRALVQELRDRGSQKTLVFRAGSMSGDEAKSYLQTKVPSMKGADLTAKVTSPKPFIYGKDDPGYWPLDGYLGLSGLKEKHQESRNIAVWDFGVKNNTLRILSSTGATLSVMPATSKAEDFLRADIHGIFLSNGPGDPAAATHIIAELKKILGKKPIFAICLGHQLVALAAGSKTFKLNFGHRGIHHPVVELSRSGEAQRTWITSQNHGFAVDPDTISKQGWLKFVHADDGSVEGISYPEWNCDTVQFHPEVGPGPFDSSVLIKNFLGETVYAGS
ncbi:MAG TPA: glutamine-hydrolyzing carbamoyl-phosphate synthase small subunit [Bdellovibrionota bacterium]|nr:glutamine-hydrolyzing carbamoyl-phosphate synthase small subunit [Bdellovibrionota bacterium]